MSVNGVSNNYGYSNVKEPTTAKRSKAENKVEKQTGEEAAVIYEKSSENKDKKVYVRDEATVQRLKAEMDSRTKSLRDLVEKMLLKQGKVYSNATDFFADLREGRIEVDPETRLQAQKDIADDGYWGVEQTSERLFSFAIALTGGDLDKADMMIAAVKKGFEEAERIWGGKLPDISYKTLDAVIKKLENWRDGLKEDQEMKDAAAKEAAGQAAVDKLV